MRVRAARDGDYAAYARLFPELRVPDPVPDEARFAAEMMATTLIAERDGAPVGVAVFQVLERAGYVRNIITDPAARRSGVGRALMEALRERFRAAGCTEWRLNVMPANAAAISLYESFGFARAYASVALGFEWALLDRGAGVRSAEARAIEPADDARVEQRLGLLPGLLADARAKEGRVLRMIEEDGHVVAAAIFNPAFPGAYPFRARSLDRALDLLGALRPHARPGDASLAVTVEDQPAIAGGLIASGATVRLEILHMRAVLA